MFGRSRFLSFPLVIGAVIIGVVSGKAIFGPPLEEYWKKRLQEEAAAKETDASWDKLPSAQEASSAKRSYQESTDLSVF
ncbi:hypothetical protein CFP56_037410 [Quercus suber]|uniref:Secreted protein n=1 Tax=Quercus suber TaxID=58331 RepID=A0AAW0LPV3_QUESU